MVILYTPNINVGETNMKNIDYHYKRNFENTNLI